MIGLFTLLINTGIVLFFEAISAVHCSFHFISYKLLQNLGKRAPLLNQPRAPRTVNPPLDRPAKARRKNSCLTKKSPKPKLKRVICLIKPIHVNRLNANYD